MMISCPDGYTTNGKALEGLFKTHAKVQFLFLNMSVNQQFFGLSRSFDGGVSIGYRS